MEIEINDDFEIKAEEQTVGKKDPLDLFCFKKDEFGNNISKCIEQIETLLTSEGDLEEIQIRKDHLKKKLGSIKSERDELFRMCSKNVKFEFDWIENLETLVDETLVDVEINLRRRKSSVKNAADSQGDR